MYGTKHTAQSVLADIPRGVVLAVAAVVARISAFPIITLSVSIAVRSHTACLVLAGAVDAASARSALTIIVASRGDAAQDGHAVSHCPIVLVVSTRITLPALCAVPHRLQIDLVVGSDQTRTLFALRLGRFGGDSIAKAPSASVLFARIALANLLLKFTAVRGTLLRVTAIVKAASAIPDAAHCTVVSSGQCMRGNH